MNVIDLIIIGSMGLIALIGLKGGIIRPASGVGGIVLGVIVGLNYQTQITALLSPHIAGDMLPRVAALGVAAVFTFVLVKALALAVTSALPKFKLGAADHALGGLGGIVVGLLLMGTMFHLLSGINVAPTREVLDSSFLAPVVTKASLVSSSIPWCSAVDPESGQACNSYTRLLGDMVGIDIRGEMESMITGDQDVDTIMSIVKASLGGGTTEDLIQIANRPQ